MTARLLVRVTCPVCRTELVTDTAAPWPLHDVRRTVPHTSTIRRRDRVVVTPCPMVGEPIRRQDITP